MTVDIIISIIYDTLSIAGDLGLEFVDPNIILMPIGYKRLVGKGHSRF